MRFKIDLKIFLFLILFYFSKQIEIYVVTILFAIIHEIGHLIAGLVLGMRPKGIKLTPYGLSISFKTIPKDYNKKIQNGNLLEIKKILIAIAGPLTNFLIILIFLHTKIDIISNMIIIYSNFLIIIFNLLPIYPLDGGRVLKGILHLIIGKKDAERSINNISFITLLIITFISSIGIYYIKNIAIFFIVVFLWILYINEDIIYKKKLKIYNLIQKTIEIEENK